MKLALIPARGGSKRIPRKNIRPFCGAPIISYSIRAAVKTGLFDRIVVSTDDDEIADIARAEGAEVPFRRPADLANDTTTTVAVIQHALRWARDTGVELSALCCLYPTAPFVRAGDIKAAIDLLETEGADYCFPVTAYPFPIQRAVRLLEDRRMEMFSPEHLNTRSQNLEPAYHDAGQFYWGRPAAFEKGVALFGPGAVGLEIPSWRVQDIDTPDDWTRAELLYEVLKRSGEL